MNTKEELLKKLIVMSDVDYIAKEVDGISLRLSNHFNSNNAQRLIDILKDYKWSIDPKHARYIKIMIV